MIEPGFRIVNMLYFDAYETRPPRLQVYQDIDEFLDDLFTRIAPTVFIRPSSTIPLPENK